jgi:hypothetical protein
MTPAAPMLMSRSIAGSGTFSSVVPLEMPNSPIAKSDSPVMSIVSTTSPPVA